MKNKLFAAALACAALLGGGAAHAGGVQWSIGINLPGVVYAPAPVYMEPAPVVYMPPPRRYYAPPPPVYVVPAPRVVYGPPQGWYPREQRWHGRGHDHWREGREVYYGQPRDGRHGDGERGYRR